MPYNNNSCNHSYSHPSYSHPYVHHQNAHAYNHGYPSQHPALTYPGYGYSGGYSGHSYCAPRYSSPSYASPSYGTPNVFSIIKTSPIDTDDNVCALNSYDTLCLDSTGSEDHLTITGDKTNKKVTFALKQVALAIAGDETAAGLALAPKAKRTSGTITLNGTTPVTTLCNVIITPTAGSGEVRTRIFLQDSGEGTHPAGATMTWSKAAGELTLVSDDANDTRVFDYLLVN